MNPFEFTIRPMSDLKDRLRTAREGKNWSQSELARRAGVTPQTIQSIESGKTRKPQNIVAIANALSVTPEYLLDGSSTGRGRVPIVGAARAGMEDIDYSTGQGNLGEVDPPEMATERTVAIEVHGDSMGGRIEDGDLVFYDDRREPVTPDLYGKLCVVGCADGRVVIKRIRPGSRPGRFHLISYNADPEIDVEVSWAAKITSIRPR